MKRIVLFLTALLLALCIVTPSEAIDRGSLIKPLGSHGQLTLAADGTVVNTSAITLEDTTAWVMISPNGTDCYLTIDGSTTPDTEDFCLEENTFMVLTWREFSNLKARGDGVNAGKLNYQQYDRYPGQ